MKEGRLRVALIGVGAWGQNYLRVLVGDPDFDVTVVADVDPEVARDAARATPRAAACASIDEALSHDVDAVIIATPSRTHAELSLRAIRAGRPVLVEKPMATTVADAVKVASAARDGNVVCVGHITLLHPAVEWLEAVVRSGELGRLLTVESYRSSSERRGARGPVDPPLWALAPHDASLALRLAGRMPETVRAWRAIGDRAQAGGVELDLGLGARAILAFDRTSAAPVRRTTVTGSSGVAHIDEGRRIGWLKTPGRPMKQYEWPDSACLLSRQCRHFRACIVERRAPRSGPEDGVEVVALLAAAEESIRRNATVAFVHPSLFCTIADAVGAAGPVPVRM